LNEERSNSKQNTEAEFTREAIKSRVSCPFLASRQPITTFAPEKKKSIFTKEIEKEKKENFI